MSGSSSNFYLCFFFSLHIFYHIAQSIRIPNKYPLRLFLLLPFQANVFIACPGNFVGRIKYNESALWRSNKKKELTWLSSLSYPYPHTRRPCIYLLRFMLLLSLVSAPSWISTRVRYSIIVFSVSLACWSCRLLLVRFIELKHRYVPIWIEHDVFLYHCAISPHLFFSRYNQFVRTPHKRNNTHVERRSVGKINAIGSCAHAIFYTGMKCGAVLWTSYSKSLHSLPPLTHGCGSFYHRRGISTAPRALHDIITQRMCTYKYEYESTT